ncbi:DUF4489 domain-containing protein [Anaeromicrobium sediminis]|uniref:Uncharacterized protein n=1 Tax=Anaeromicrobium sediminis TaxID=1478221 RepID=A0A267MGV4_9FIRM|nr:DUF4489 domain-containing protein [Anaeromicrobium sediminis]PAB58799.1 hypothetical protein CCE28_12950 [Anaeromicrobium sediminis]
MTYNHTYQDYKACELDRNLAKCKLKHSKPRKILLECGEGTGSRTFASSNEVPFQLAHVTLDTTCLDESQILIKFSSLVKMERLIDGATVRLKYELFKVCDHKEPKSLGIWMFEETDVTVDTFEVQEEAFSFIFCDCITCLGCSDYFVAVTPIEIDGATATISNGRMAALSQSLCDSLEKYDKIFDSKHHSTKFIGKHPKPKDILIECGEGNGSVILREESEVEPPFQIAHVTLDTACLSKAKVLIEFSSMIKIDRLVEDIRLQFELFRVCGDGEAVSRGIWTFERTDVSASVELEKVFDFTFCECEVPRGCLEYFVKVTPLKIDISGNSADVVVDNARMVALAQSSRGLDDCITINRKDNCIDCVPKHPIAKKIVLECGEGTGSRTFTSSNEPAFQLAKVTIDTTSLCKPMVNIEFSSIVSFDSLINFSDARLRYELLRVCDNKRPISLGVWVSERILRTSGELGKSTNIFNFTFCDCITCPGCCDYFVTVTPIQITEGSVTATVSNGRMAALAQERYNNKGWVKNNHYKSPVNCTNWKPKPTKMKKVLLECGDGTGSKTFTSSDEASFQLAHVTLDTICLDKPEVLIKFSSIVCMLNLSTSSQEPGTVRLQYDLFRVCEDEEPKSLGTWIFDEVNVRSGAFDRQEESFSFIFCDRIACPGCCEYFVTVTPIEIDNATATVSNGRMAALSQPLWASAENEHKNFHSKKDILLECGQGNGSVVFRRDTESLIELDPPVEIAHVTIDTTYLTKPKALIEFSSMIKVDDGVDDIRLQFELFRVCGDGEPLSRGIWNFERTDVNEFIELNKVFDFTFCECEVPSGCCEYFVTVTPLEINIDIVGADIVVDNARMVALVQTSGNYDDCRIFNGKSDYIHCVPKYPTAKKIVLECGEGTGSRTFTSANDPAFQLAHVNIDITCLCNPMVNIEFSSIVSFEGSGDGRLRYELFRVCDNKEPTSLGIWVSERIGISFFDRTTNIFNFTFCDCITCPGCCDYLVIVTPIRISAELTATVSNARIAALAQGK